MVEPAGYDERVLELSARLSGLQRELQRGRSSQLEQLQSKLRNLESSLAKAQNAAVKRLHPLRGELFELRSRVEAARLAGDESAEAQRAQAASINGRLQAAFEDEQRQGAEQEALLLKTFDERSSLLREAVEREGGLRQSAEELLHRFLGKEVPELRARLCQAAEDRDAMESRALQRVRLRLEELRRAAAAEAEARQNSEQALLRMCSELGAQLRADVDRERRARETAEEALVELLEAAHDRLNEVLELSGGGMQVPAATPAAPAPALAVVDRPQADRSLRGRSLTGRASGASSAAKHVSSLCKGTAMSLLARVV
ncbi:unnamed protein product [Polarella glacialis]|uniref:Uncharacterized protein n=1 Tax=Polarella glacialis TaxID=89957 RepID=A0A813JPC1_POLGL|nr:unnamed protein product [Polarella glacialis]